MYICINNSNPPFSFSISSISADDAYPVQGNYTSESDEIDSDYLEVSDSDPTMNSLDTSHNSQPTPTERWMRVTESQGHWVGLKLGSVEDSGTGGSRKRKREDSEEL